LKGVENTSILFEPYCIWNKFPYLLKKITISTAYVYKPRFIGNRFGNCYYAHNVDFAVSEIRSCKKWKDITFMIWLWIITLELLIGNIRFLQFLHFEWHVSLFEKTQCSNVLYVICLSIRQYSKLYKARMKIHELINVKIV
jgi:hypothetical protein